MEMCGLWATLKPAKFYHRTSLLEPACQVVTLADVCVTLYTTQHVINSCHYQYTGIAFCWIIFTMVKGKVQIRPSRSGSSKRSVAKSIPASSPTSVQKTSKVQIPFENVQWFRYDCSVVKTVPGVNQWRINHDANDAMAWGPPLKGAPRAESASDSWLSLLTGLHVIGPLGN